jgi:hypothetical protein
MDCHCVHLDLPDIRWTLVKKKKIICSEYRSSPDSLFGEVQTNLSKAKHAATNGILNENNVPAQCSKISIMAGNRLPDSLCIAVLFFCIDFLLLE